jgi:hypothetical protein
MRILAIVLVLYFGIALYSCTSIPLTPEELEERDIEEIEQLSLCMDVYKRAGVATQHNHMHAKHKRHGRWEVRDDLRVNRCRQVLEDNGLWEY